MPTARTLGAAALATLGFALVAPAALLASAGDAQAQPPADSSSGQPELGTVRPFYYPGKKTTSPFELSDSPLSSPIVSMPAPTLIDGAGLRPYSGNADTPLSDGSDGSLAARRLTPYPLASANGVDLRSFFAFDNPGLLSEGADGTDFRPVEDRADGASGEARSGSGASTGGNTGTGADASKGGAGADGEPGSRDDSSEN
jgi:hypothetical protein